MASTAEFRFDVDEIDVRRDTPTGDVFLSKTRASWDEFFAWVETLDLPADFLANCDQPQHSLRDPFADNTLKKRRATA